MPAGILMSVEEYLKRTGKPNAEYVNGVLIEKRMPTWEHSVIQMWIGALIFRLFPKYVAASELHSRIGPTEFRLPDVAVALRSEITLRGYAKEPLYLCIEILSPEDRVGETLAKLERYHDWGVPYCWMIDPSKRRAWSYERGGEPLDVSSTLNAGEIQLEVAEIFSVLDGSNC